MNPLIRHNTECGTDQNVMAGREPCQNGWYEWVGLKFCRGKTVLDVGAGMCEGLSILKQMGAKDVQGQDVDERLKKVNPAIFIGDIMEIYDKSVDVVTCFDVIEHVIEDNHFVKHLRRIAREKVIITTPNFTRSQARNHFHCREYTIPQFANWFSPDDLWTASPDGRVHHHLLLKKAGDIYVDITRKDTTYPVQGVPEDLSFCHSTVDGNEWPHICGVFYL